MELATPTEVLRQTVARCIREGSPVIVEQSTDIEFATEVGVAAVLIAWEHPDWSAQECAKVAVSRVMETP